MELEVVEIWRQVLKYSNYEVSDFGRVRSMCSGEARILQCESANGYKRFSIRLCGAVVGKLFVHRAIFEAFERPLDPKEHIDHIDGDRTNNRLSNLRVCSNTDNQANRGASSNSTSMYKGVSWCSKRRKWRAQIKVNSQSRHIGYYEVEAEAALAYNEIASVHFGAFAFINKVPNASVNR